MKQIIQTQIDKISAECSSIYSKEDVIKILTTIGNSEGTESENILVNTLLNKVVEIFKEKIESVDSNELVDYDTAQFRIERYNEVVIDYIDVAEFTICELLGEAITEAKQY